MRVWDQRKPVTRRALLSLLLKSVIILPLMLAVYKLFPAFLATHSFSWWVRGYLALVPFIIFAKTVDVIFQLILLPFFGSVPPFLDKPCLSQSLSEFWELLTTPSCLRNVSEISPIPQVGVKCGLNAGMLFRIVSHHVLGTGGLLHPFGSLRLQVCVGITSVPSGPSVFSSAKITATEPPHTQP